MERSYKKLIVWQKADELAYQIYLATKSFPKEEIYGVTSQIRRAALSVPTNIAEGTGRQNKGEFKQFLNIALGSIAEVDYLLHFSARLGYLQQDEEKCLSLLQNDVSALLWKLYKSI